MKNPLNKRRLLLLALVFVTLCVGAGGLYGYRQHRIRQHFLSLRADGMAAAEAGDPTRAVNLLGPYLIRYGNDVEALRKYQACRAEVPAPDNAHIGERIRILRHLLRLSPNLIDERKALMSLYLQGGMLAEAQDAATQVLAAAPADAEALGVRARVLLRLSKFAEAVKFSAEWVKAAPDDLDANLVHVVLLKQNNTSSLDLRTHVDGLLKAYPNDPKFEVVAAVGWALTMTPAELAPDAARPKALLRAAAARPIPDLATGQALLSQLDRHYMLEDSTKLLERLSTQFPDLPTKLELAQRYWHAQRPGDVVTLLADLDAADATVPREALALKALGLLQLKRTAEVEPIRAALTARKEDPAAQAWTVILQQLADGNEFDARAVLAACNAVGAAHGASGYLQFFRGEALARLGETELAIQEWRAVARQNASWVAPLVRLSAVLTQMGRTQEAVEAAGEAFRRDQQNGAAQLTLLHALVAHGQAGDRQASNDALSFLEAVRAEMAKPEATNLDPVYLEQTLLLYVSMLGHVGDADRAKSLIQEALASPQSLTEQTLLALAAVSQRLSLGLELDVFARSERDHGVTPKLAYAKAVRAFAGGEAERGLTEFDAARAGADAVEWRLNRARYLDLMSDPAAGPQAAEIFAALADERPDDLQIQQAVLNARAVRSEADLQKRTIARVKALTGEQGLAWRVAQARWLLVHGGGNDTSLKQAIAELESIILRTPDSLPARLLAARAYRQAKRHGDAIREYEAAADLSADPAPIRLELSEAAYEAGDLERSRAALNQIGGALASREQRRRAAALWAQQGNAQPAIQLLEELEGGMEAGDKTALAQLYVRRNQLDQAVTIYAELLAAEPTADVVSAAADVYTKLGRTNEARQTLARLDAMELKPGEREMRKAQFAARIGAEQEAMELLRAATAAAPTDLAPWRALTLGYVSTGDVGQAQDTIKRAAQAIAADTTPAGHEAGKAIGHTLAQSDLLALADEVSLRPMVAAFVGDSSPDGPAAQTLQLLLKARASGISPEQRAQQLRQIADKHPRFLPVQLHLAEQYAANGRPDDAAIIASRAARLFPGAVEPQALLTGILMGAQRWSEALTAARDWRQRAGGSLAADLAEAECHLALKDATAAGRVLAPHLAAAREGKPGYDRVLELHGRAEQALGRSNLAQSMEPLLQQGREGRQRWLAYAVERLEPVEAEAWIRRAQAAVPEDQPDELVMVADAWIVLGERAKEPRYAETGRTLLKSMADSAKPTALALFAWASRLERDGDLRAAEAAYLQAIKVDPRSAIALNNLAMLLSRDGSRLSEAEAHIDAALKVWPAAAPLHDTRATVLARAGKHSAALESIRRAVQLQPGSVGYRLHMIQLLIDAGQQREAQAAFREIEPQIRAVEPNLPAELRQQLESLRNSFAKLAAG